MAELKTNQQGSKMTLVFDEIPPGLNGPKGLIRMGWRSRVQYGNRWRLLVRQALGDLGNEWKCYKEKVQITFTVYPIRAMDDDNIASSFKLVGDALKHWEVIEDDGPKFVKLVVKQEHVKHREERHCTVEIEPLVSVLLDEFLAENAKT